MIKEFEEGRQGTYHCGQEVEEGSFEMVIGGVVDGEQPTFGLGKSGKGIIELADDVAVFGLHGSQLDRGDEVGRRFC
jgi:hypothetical protein